MKPFEEYRITSPYGRRDSPITGKTEFHTGIDLAKQHQAPIYTFTEGEILYADEGFSGSGFGGYGNVVAVKDTDGHLHCYCHLDTSVVKTGMRVEKGAMIGRQGATGQVTGSHLHYEVRKRTLPSYGWIQDAGDRCFEPTQYLIDYYKKHYSSEPEKQVETHLLVEEDAEKIIRFLSAGWFATESQEARNEFKRLADEVRKAAGITIEE